METKPQVWHDWVGDLFEPVFGSTIDDLVAHEEEAKNKPRVKHISVHDPEAIRKVYEKVHMMTKLEEELKKEKQKKASQALAVQQVTIETEEPKSTEHKVAEDRPGSVTVDLEKSCIWDSGEIAVLRSAYRSLKDKSIEANVHVRETVKRNKELEEQVVRQQKVIDSQREKLMKARNANRRLKISVDSSKDEVQYLTAKVGAMEEVIRELKQEHADMVSELHDNRVSTDRERMERERIQLKLDSLKQEALAEKLAAEDNIRTMCRQAIHDLREKVKKLEAELQEERLKRKTTEKGLSHLRTHFSSLSVQDILPPNVVAKDQLQKVQY